LGPRTNTFVASGPSTVKKDQIAERGARLARRDDRKYREYVREEQRRQTGCPAHEVVLFHRGRATSPVGDASLRSRVMRRLPRRSAKREGGLTGKPARQPASVALRSLGSVTLYEVPVDIN
jgi:hypothetical protein